MTAWTLLIDADLSQPDWQYSGLTDATLLRIEQENIPRIGRFSIAQVTADQSEFLDIKGYPAASETTRLSLDYFNPVGRLIAIRPTYSEFPEGVANNWRVRIYGSKPDFQPPINPSAIVLTLDPRIAGAIPLEEKGIPLGVASLDETGVVPDSQLLGSGLADLIAANMESVDALSNELTLYQQGLEMTIQNAINNAFRAGVQFVLGSDAPGDIYFRSASGPLARLGIGSNGQALVVNSGLPAWANQTAMTWATITGTTQAAAINTGYVVNASSLCTITLPATAAVGSILEIVGVGAGGWRLGQAAGQQVVFGSLSNTSGTGGQLNSTHQRDAIRLICIVADTTWQVVSSIGNIDVI